MNTLTDGSILRTLGVALERDERQVARPVAVAGAVPIVFRVCSWCKRGLGVAECEPQRAGTVTDAICPSCRLKLANQLYKRAA